MKPKRRSVVDETPREPKQVNIFTKYSQKENHFTNGLTSILQLINIEKQDLVKDFFQEMVPSINLSSGRINKFQVLEGYKPVSTADAILFGDDAVIMVETKIVSASINKEQIDKHLGDLRNYSQKHKYLVLLTPDNSGSSYVKKHIDNVTVYHVEWKKVYNFLKNYRPTNKILESVINQYLETLSITIFDCDIVGIIAKVSFDQKSGVDANKYLKEMREGEWSKWNTPRQYKNLDGTGRKLLLYDKNKHGITLEVEIKEVKETKLEVDYPLTNYFEEDTIRIFEPAIPISKIMSLRRFENFVKERAPCRNITHDNYRKLTEMKSQ